MLAGARVRAEEEEEVHRGGGGGGAYTTICVAVSGRAGGPRSRSYHYDRPPETQSGRGLSVWHATPVVSESRVCGQTVWWAPADGASFYHRTMRPPGRFVWELPPLLRGTRTSVRLYGVSEASCCYFSAAYPQRRIVAFLARARSALALPGAWWPGCSTKSGNNYLPRGTSRREHYHLRSGMPRRTRPTTAGGPGASRSTEARLEFLGRKPAELVASAARSGDWRRVIAQKIENARQAARDGDEVFGRLRLTVDDGGPSPAQWLSDVCDTCSQKAPWKSRLPTVLATVYDRTVSVQRACTKDSPEWDVVKKFAICLRDLIVVGCISVSGHRDRDAFLKVVSSAFGGRMSYASRKDWTEVDMDRYAAMNHSFHQVMRGFDGSFESNCDQGRLRPPRVQRPIAEAADGPLSRRGRDPEESEEHGSTQQGTGVAESARQEGAAEDTPAPRDRAAELSPVTQQTRIGIDDNNKVARRRSDGVAELTRQVKRQAEDIARLEGRLKCEEAERRAEHRALETLIIAIAYGGGAEEERFLHHPGWQRGAREQAVSNQLRSISGEPSPPQLAAPQMMMYQGPCHDVLGAAAAPSAGARPLASGTAAVPPPPPGLPEPPAVPRRAAAEAEGGGAEAVPGEAAGEDAAAASEVPRWGDDHALGQPEPSPPSQFTEVERAVRALRAAAQSEARPGADVKNLTSVAAGLLEMARKLSAKPGEDTSRTCDGAIYRHHGHPDVMTSSR